MAKMKPKFSGRKLRISTRLVLKNKNKVVLDTSCQKKSLILASIKCVPHTKGYIKVGYGQGLFNDGWYNNDFELLRALKNFTERGLLRMLEEQDRT